MSAVTIYGLCAVSFMMGMYALERRGRIYIVGFAVGCLLSSTYGFLSGAWPFGFVEIVWCGVALLRLRPRAGGPGSVPPSPSPSPSPSSPSPSPARPPQPPTEPTEI